VVRLDTSWPPFAPTEGGYWKLVPPDNNAFGYGPTNLDNVYRIDGLRVTATLKLSELPDLICGEPRVEIIKIAPLP